MARNFGVDPEAGLSKSFRSSFPEGIEIPGLELYADPQMLKQYQDIQRACTEFKAMIQVTGAVMVKEIETLKAGHASGEIPKAEVLTRLEAVENGAALIDSLRDDITDFGNNLKSMDLPLGTCALSNRKGAPAPK